MIWSSAALLDRPRQGVVSVAGEDDLHEVVGLLLDVPRIGGEELVVFVLGLAELVGGDLALGGVEDHFTLPVQARVFGVHLPHALNRLVEGALLGGGGGDLRRSAGVTAGHHIGRGVIRVGAAARAGTSSLGRTGVAHGDQDRQDTGVPHSGPRRLTVSLTTIRTLFAPRLWWYACWFLLPTNIPPQSSFTIFPSLVCIGSIYLIKDKFSTFKRTTYYLSINGGFCLL